MVYYKCMLREYYRQNLLFYGIILFLGFGIVRSDEHLQIAGIVIEQPMLILWFSIIWLAHTFKTLRFVYASLQDPKFQLFYDLSLFQNFEKEVVLTQLGLNAPYLFYAGFWIIYALLKSKWLAIALIGLCLLFLISVSSYLLVRRIKTLGEKEFIPFKRIVPSIKGGNWFLRYLGYHRTFMLLGTKLLSCLLIAYGSEFYYTDRYDFRLLNLICFFVMIGHIQVAISFKEYKERYLFFMAGLPLKGLQGILSLIVAACLLILPETVFLWFRWFEIVHESYIFQATIYLLFGLLALLSLSFLQIKNDKYFFFAGAIHFVLIMYKIPMAVFCILFLGLVYRVRSKLYS